MYCRICGTELNGANFCPNCGTPTGQGVPHPVPPITSGIADSEVLFRSTESKVFGAISSFVIGAGMIGGGIYGIIALRQYTDWVIVGSAFTILGGIGCMVKGVSLVSRLVSRKGKEE